MLSVGDKLPAFTLSVQQGTSALPGGETVDLTTHAPGKWKILFFWPKDFTFICPTEIIGYNDLASDFVHFAWRKSDPRLAACDFPWVADNKHELTRALGILDKDAGVALRATFIVDPENVIQHITVNGLNVGRNPVETLRILDALQTDELCPCNWQGGEETLHPIAA